MAKWRGLTDAELDILAVLWQKGPSTVREVYETLPQGERGYTTVLKFLQLMHEKGLVERDEGSRAHVYRAASAADESKQGIVRDLMARLFGGSAKALMLNAIGTDHDPARLAEVSRILDEMEKSK